MFTSLVRLVILCAPVYALAATPPTPAPPKPAAPSAPSASSAQFGMESQPETVARWVLGARPGSAAVGLWHDEKAFYAEVRRAGAGQEAVSQPDGDSQLFEIGSISKVFTGLLLAQAVERGDLTLDDTLGELLPRLLAAPQEHTPTRNSTRKPTQTPKQAPKLPAQVAAITLRQLVTHTSCLPRLPANFPDVAAANPYEHYTRAMMLAELSATRLKQAAPCAAAYSNFGFAVLGEVLSLRYGQPWEALVIERIATPLGMRDTRQHLGAQAARLAPPFNGDKRASQWDFEAFAGAGGLRSSAADMLRFGRALMAGRDGPLGAPAERVLQPLDTMPGVQIGYALMMRGPVERRTYYHSGGTGGFRTQLMMLPDAGQVSIVMVSNDEAQADGFGAQVLAARYKISDASFALDAAALPEYAGVFRVDDKMAFTFVVQDGKLYGRLTGQPYTAMAAAAPDVFTLPQYGAEFTFGRENGKVATMTLRQAGGQFLARRTAEPPPSVAFDKAIAPEVYAGHYLSPANGGPRVGFDVVVSDGQMSARVDRQQFLPVFPVSGKADRFAWDVVAAELLFERDAGGAVTALVLHQDGHTVRAIRAAGPLASSAGTAVGTAADTAPTVK